MLPTSPSDGECGVVMVDREELSEMSKRNRWFAIGMVSGLAALVVTFWLRRRKHGEATTEIQPDKEEAA